MDRLMQNANNEREGGRQSHAIKTPEIPTYAAPVYNAPIYPGPPGSLPVPSYQTPTISGPPSNTSTAPTFEYKSAYTNESYQFQAKQYATTPGQQISAASEIPTATYPLPGQQTANYPAPNLPTLEKKTFTLPPSSTRNMATPESPFTKGTAPQTTTAGSKTMSFKEEDGVGASDSDAKNARKQKLAEALKLKATLQAEKEKNDQQKISGLTPEQLEEKRRADQEKLELDLANKALQKLDEESAGLKQQIDQTQSEIQQYQQKSLKLSELKSKFEQTQSQATQKQDQAVKDQSNVEMELAMTQSELVNMKSKTQSLTEQIAQTKLYRDSISKQLLSLNEEKQTLVLATSEDVSLLSQSTEKIEALVKEREQETAQMKVTESQLEEIRTTGVILDPFLQAKIEEAKKKLQVAQAEVNQNETKLNELISKLDAANQKEKDQEQESEQMYTDVEVMCQAKETMDKQIENLKVENTSLEASLSDINKVNQDLVSKLSLRQKYLYDVQSTNERSSKELECQQQIRDILASLALLNQYQTEDENTLVETEKACDQDSQQVSTETNSTQVTIDEEIRAIQTQNEELPETKNQLQTVQNDVSELEAQIKQIESEQNSQKEQFTQLCENKDQESKQKIAAEEDLYSVLLDRMALVDASIQDTETKSNHCKLELETESESIKSNQKEESDLLEVCRKQKEQQQTYINLLSELKEKHSQSEDKIVKYEQYFAESKQAFESGSSGLSLLKSARLAEIAEAFAQKLELERVEANLDEEHAKLQGEIVQTKEEVSKFEEAKSQLEQIRTKQNAAEIEHKDWISLSLTEQEAVEADKNQLGLEHQEHKTKVEIEVSQSEQVRLTIAEVNQTIQEHVLVVENNSTSISGLVEEIGKLEKVHVDKQTELKQSQEEAESISLEKDQILAAMVETDPEFVDKVQKVTDQINSADTNLTNLDKQTQVLDSQILDEDQKTSLATTELSEIQAKLEELSREKSVLDEQDQREQKDQTTLRIKKDELTTQFASQDQKLKHLQTYLEELERLITESNDEVNTLKAKRLAEIEELMRDKLDAEQREAHADAELEELKLQIQEVQADIELCGTATVELIRFKEKFDLHDQDFLNWRAESDTEHQLHVKAGSDTQSSQVEISSELQNLTEMQKDLQIKSDQFLQSLSEVDHHIQDLTQNQSQHTTQITDLDSLLVSAGLNYQNEKDTHTLEVAEIETLSANMAQTDPDFDKNVQELNEKLNQLQAEIFDNESQVKQLEDQIADQNVKDAESALQEAMVIQHTLKKESEDLNQENQLSKSKGQSLSDLKQTAHSQFEISKAKNGEWLKYLQECIALQEQTQKETDQLRHQRLQEVEEAIRAKLDGEKLEEALDSQINQLNKDISTVQLEIDEYFQITEQHSKANTRLQEVQQLIATDQSDQEKENALISEENKSLDQNLESVKQEIQQDSEHFGITSQNSQQIKQDLISVQNELSQSQELFSSQELLLQNEKERSDQVQNQLKVEKKEQIDSENQLFIAMQDRILVIEHLSASVILDQANQDLQAAILEGTILNEEGRKQEITENLDMNSHLRNSIKEKSDSAATTQNQLNQLTKYEQELRDLISTTEDIIQKQKAERIQQIQDLLEQERLRQEEVERNLQTVSAVQPVNSKRRHARNQSLIGNDLANSTFDSSQPSNISGAELELKVKEALDRDSQGQKVTFYDLKEESNDVIEEELDDDQFFSDSMIERKRVSERSRRSSSSHSDKEQNEQREPQSQFNKDNHLRKLRWANPTLRHIDECSEEQLVSEYGSEVGGHDFGRTGSGMFGLSTSQRLINKSTKLNQFGVVGPQSEQQTSQNAHNRNESAGSVQVPISEEHIEEQSPNLVPTVPVPTIVPVARPSETRPSIFDMQRKNSTQGSYRATTYDKQAPTKRIANALKQKLGHIVDDAHDTEQHVLGDLLVCLLAQKQILSIQSDFEMNQGFSLFEQMMKDDPKCHEGMFGLGRINYIQGRYELAEKWLLKAYEVKRDFSYRVWLGFAQMQLYRVCTAENPKKIKFVQNAIANLDRCAKEVKVGVYASFGLLYLSLQLQTSGLQVKGLQDPSYYEAQIRGYSTQVDLYEGELASAIIKLATNQAAAGVKQLIDLLAKERPHAYYVLIHYYLRTNDLVKARQTADDAFNKLTGYENFQERLMITLLMCKCYYKTGNHAKLLVTLQNQLLESPHFSSLLYVYGKYIIQSFKLADYLQSAISALQECMRVSCQVRRAKCAYWLSLAYQATGQLTQCGINQYIYVNEIKQVVKSGPVQFKGVKSRVNVNVQKQIREKVQNCYLPIQKYATDVLFTTPQQCLKGQMSDPEWPNDADLTNACQRIPQQRDQLLYKAITSYKIKKDYQLADQILLTLSREHPEDFEIQSENANFIRVAITNSYKPQRQETPKQEALKLLEMLENCEVQGDLWANAHTQCAKLLSVIAHQSDDFNLLIKAIECLLKIKNTLPVIDTKIAAVKLPGTTSRYLFEEFDHVDFQASLQAVEEDKEDNEFKPQDDYDDTNKFFGQSLYFQSKLKACPLATLSVAEIKDQIRIKGETVFFFGGAQTELAYQAEEITKEIQENNMSDQVTAKIYYRSSTPLICVIKYLQHIRRMNSGQESIVQVLPEAVSDVGFCIYSDPAWLYQIAKMCVKWNVFVDLAVHCIQLYLQIVNYYKHFYPTDLLDTKGQLLLAKVLIKLSTNSTEDKPFAESIIQVLTPKVAQSITSAKQASNEWAIKSALKNEKNLQEIVQLLA